MSDKEIFTRKETSNLIQQARREGSLEELKRIEEAWHHIGSKGVCNYIEKRIKELGGETK